MEFSDSEMVKLCSTKAATKYEEFRQNFKFCDVRLQSGDVVIKAHRAVLAAASVYFETMFDSGFKESNVDLINLPGIHPDVLPLLLDYIYTGRVIINSTTVQELMVAAHMLCLDGLVIGCISFLKSQLDTSNALNIFSFAETLGCSAFSEYTLGYIGEQWPIIAQGKELLELPLHVLIKILSSNRFSVENELQVVCAVVRWLEHSPGTRVPQCADLMCHVRLGRVPQHVLTELWRTVKDTEVAESLRMISENKVARSNVRPRGFSALYVVENPRHNRCGVVYKYSIQHKSWEHVVSINEIRYNPGVAGLHDRLYVVGGIGDKPLASATVYDPVTEKWSSIADMNEARSHFGLVALKGKLYALGGRGVDGELASVEAYDPEADEWTRVGNLPHPMSAMSVVTYNGAVYVLHARGLLRYYPSPRAGGVWRACPPPRCLGHGHAAAVYEERLYVAGGVDRRGEPLGPVQRYNFVTERWEFTTSNARVATRALTAADGVLLLVRWGAVEAYDAADERWTQQTDAPKIHDAAGSALLCNEIDPKEQDRTPLNLAPSSPLEVPEEYWEED